ncbi:hypothetical protein O7543_12565 [Solwaraspora sp. WMMA2080]|uniref:hypothetical protein n=1 Tax=unclassified Solwaraspora TaxID=2627926 RepID=UPI00248CB43B|nr:MULTISPECIES: hypothetical protein [unclassified Solwaraspora]WBB98260.1 hypothetical protein O7553_04800 [Solwaraspora sp. WMMA2059]WBC23186.1 hypothetical protein O7543_12565 [Solwaraspora sp. WMMA2080]
MTDPIPRQVEIDHLTELVDRHAPRVGGCACGDPLTPTGRCWRTEVALSRLRDLGVQVVAADQPEDAR